MCLRDRTKTFNELYARAGMPVVKQSQESYIADLLVRALSESDNLNESSESYVSCFNPDVYVSNYPKNALTCATHVALAFFMNEKVIHSMIDKALSRVQNPLFHSLWALMQPYSVNAGLGGTRKSGVLYDDMLSLHGSITSEEGIDHNPLRIMDFLLGNDQFLDDSLDMFQVNFNTTSYVQ